MTENSKTETTRDGTGAPAPRSYAEAAEELEELLDQLEGADVDVDLLAQQVARGVQLIRFCRARLEVVTADVEEVVAELISVDNGATEDAATGDGAGDQNEPDEGTEPDDEAD